MAKNKPSYACNECGAPSTRLDGRCLRCGTFGSITEQKLTVSRSAPEAKVQALHEIDLGGGGEMRVRTGIEELDRVLGGGLVSGSLVLLGGDPGVGKSTLVLLALDRFARRGLPVLYATGEESARQVRLRADRLGVTGTTLYLLADTDLGAVEAAVQQIGPAVVIIDSVQTMSATGADGVPGSPSQVREVAHRARQLAKRNSASVILVGHITKSGDLAGPKLLEHLVDTVLYFEGDGRTGLRVLRSVKNRFGASGELGLFEMADEGLVEVPDASARLLEERSVDTPGTAVVASVEGSRPLLVELQALVSRPTQQFAARTVVGVDRTRILMIAAVLEKAGVPLYDRDLFVNAAGGVKLTEPAADLAIAAAIASSFTDRSVPSDVLVFGEIGLVGEVRAVGQSAVRLREAARHGFRRVIAPAAAVDAAPQGLDVVGVRSLREALNALGLGR